MHTILSRKYMGRFVFKSSIQTVLILRDGGEDGLTRPFICRYKRYEEGNAVIFILLLIVIRLAINTATIPLCVLIERWIDLKPPKRRRACFRVCWELFVAFCAGRRCSRLPALGDWRADRAQVNPWT